FFYFRDRFQFVVSYFAELLPEFSDPCQLDCLFGCIAEEPQLVPFLAPAVVNRKFVEPEDVLVFERGVGEMRWQRLLEVYTVHALIGVCRPRTVNNIQT